VRQQAKAGILAGLIKHLRGDERHEGSRHPSDAMIDAQVASPGCVVPTQNAQDFDLLDQLVLKSGTRRIAGRDALGTSRGLFGNIGLMAPIHSQSEFAAHDSKL